MKRRRISDASLLAGRNRLGCTCGTNIDTEDIEFTRQQPNLMYIDKVFSFNNDTASPILFNLNTGGQNTNNFITELTLDGCSLFPCTLSSNAVFEIDNSFVAVEYFNTRPPGNIAAPQVTLDGFPVDSVSFSNGQYTAATTNVLSKVQKERCLNRNLPTKAFFLISNAGPWDLRATFVFEGTVNTNGRTCRFRLQISNAPDSANISLPTGSLSSFAIPQLSLPCIVDGVAPTILFQFNAKVNLVNPRLVVNCSPIPTTAGGLGVDSLENGRHCCPPCPEVGSIFDNPCRVSLASAVAVEPVVHVETVRKTLFCVNACEGLQPCQGNLVAAEAEDIAEECVLGGVDRPDCQCNKGRDRDDVGGVSRCNRRNEVLGTAIECGGQVIPAGVAGEVTVGAGTCEDCVWGDTRMHDCRRRRSDDDDAMGASDIDRRHRTTECDIEDDDDELLEEELRRRARTAFQFNGCNGCSW